jgi:uncharacterized membrane protein
MILTPTQRRLHLLCLVSLLGLIGLCIAWELVLAPLRPGGSWVVLKVLPLFFPLIGTLRRNLYTMQWASMMILLYFTEGVVRAWSERGLSQGLAGAEIVLALVYFFCAIFFLQPYKRAAKKMTQEIVTKAAEPHEH